MLSFYFMVPDSGTAKVKYSVKPTEPKNLADETMLSCVYVL